MRKISRSKKRELIKGFLLMLLAVILNLMSRFDSNGVDNLTYVVNVACMLLFLIGLSFLKVGLEEDEGRD